MANITKTARKRKAALKEGYPLRKKVKLPTGQVVHGTTVTKKPPKTRATRNVVAKMKGAGATIKQLGRKK